MNNFYKNKLFLAPMAGVTDLAFRTLCKEYGADLVVSEMISSRGLHYKDKKTSSLLKTNKTEEPLIVQLFGNEPNIMAESAKYLENTGVSYIDINMGCPAPKIVKNGDGCALMKDEVLAGRIVKAVTSSVSIPVSVKFRAGWDEKNKNASSFAKIMEESGVSALFVHGRTKEQHYSGHSDLEIIRDVKNSVSIPVIGNGDIVDGISAKKMLDVTNCDSLMIGRGSLGNPFVFNSIKSYFNDEIIEKTTIEQRKNAMLKHIELCRESKSENRGVPEMRKHIAWYLKGLAHSSKYKIRVFSAKTYEEMINLIKEL